MVSRRRPHFLDNSPCPISAPNALGHFTPLFSPDPGFPLGAGTLFSFHFADKKGTSLFSFRQFLSFLSAEGLLALVAMFSKH